MLLNLYLHIYLHLGIVLLMIYLPNDHLKYQPVINHLIVYVKIVILNNISFSNILQYMYVNSKKIN